MRYQLPPNKVNEVHVQRHIDYCKDSFFYAVPDAVEQDPVRVDLQASRHPDDEYADVDGPNQESYGYLEFPDMVLVVYDKSNAVDDDLHNAMHLYHG